MSVKGGEKMYRVGGSTGVFGLLKTVPPGAFHSADIQTLVSFQVLWCMILLPLL